MQRADGSAAGPSTSASRPAPRRRIVSICHSRSSACAQPSAKLASSSVAAKMYGTAHLSRNSETGALSPSTSYRPLAGIADESSQRPPTAELPIATTTAATVHLHARDIQPFCRERPAIASANSYRLGGSASPGHYRRRRNIQASGHTPPKQAGCTRCERAVKRYVDGGKQLLEPGRAR